jgi:hypothetical protein
LLDVKTGGHFGANRRAFWRVLANVRMIGGAPTQPATHCRARSFYISQANRVALFFVGSEQLRSAPSRERGRKFPRKIDSVSHAGIHAESAGRYHQMRGVSGDKNAAFTVTLRAEQMLRPFVHRKHIEPERHPQ